MASGKQRAWSVVQSLCVVMSAALDPLLVPWFQRRTGNGGAGICVASVLSEGVVVACGVALAPPGVFDRKLVRMVFPALASGAVMAGVARVVEPLGSFVAAPVALLAYGTSLWFTGGLEKRHIDAVRGFVSRKFSRSGT